MKVVPPDSALWRMVREAGSHRVLDSVFWRSLSLCALLLMLSSCQCIGPVSAIGSIASGVIFQASGSWGGRHFKLLELTIQDFDKPNDTNRWQIQGAAVVSAVQYGVVPSGMGEIVPAQPLEPGHTYRLIGWVDSGGVYWGSPRCRLMGSFFIDANGAVTEVPQPSEVVGRAAVD